MRTPRLWYFVRRDLPTVGHVFPTSEGHRFAIDEVAKAAIDWSRWPKIKLERYPVFESRLDGPRLPNDPPDEIPLSERPRQVAVPGLPSTGEAPRRPASQYMRQLKAALKTGGDAGALERAARPRLLTRVVNSDAVFSRIGGEPTMPARFAWPVRGGTSGKGRALEFLAQIDLGEASGPALSKLPAGVRPPKSGRLWFFYDMEDEPWGIDPKDRDGWAVLHAPSDEPVVATRRPEGGGGGGGQDYDQTPVQFVETLSLPDELRPAGSRGRGGAESDDDGDDVSGPEELDAALYGYVPRVHESMAGTCAEVAPAAHAASVGGAGGGARGPRTGASKADAGSGLGADPGAHPRADPGADPAGWTPLLHLPGTSRWGWGDEGCLCFWIRTADLAAGDFSRVWCVVASH